MYAILPRKAPFGAVFRRGPSKSVLLIGWNTSNDTFQQGQWLRGRIYERRCDLSPDGNYFTSLPAIANRTIPGQPSADLHTLPRWHYGLRAMDGEVAVTSCHSTGLHSTWVVSGNLPYNN